MSRTLHIDVELTVKDDADDHAVADAVLDYLCRAEDDGRGDKGMDPDVPGMESCDGADPIRQP